MIRQIRQFISNHRLKGLFVLAALLGVGAYSIHSVQAHYNFSDFVGNSYSTFSPPFSNGCGGQSCHGFPIPNQSTSVTISTAATEIVAGQTYIFQIEVKNTNKLLVAAGCDITVDTNDAGIGPVLDTVGTTPPQGLSYFATIFGNPINELAHSMPKSFGGGDSAVWLFKFTAPTTPGQYIIYAAGNAVNGDSAEDGVNPKTGADTDQWNVTTDTITVVALNSVNVQTTSASDIQVYPNPSTGQVNLSATNEHGLAEVKITDGAGKAIETRNIDLGNNAPLDLTSLPNGTYFLHIEASDGQSFIRRVVIKK